MRVVFKLCIGLVLSLFLLAPLATAKTPPEVLKYYKAYRAGLKAQDNKIARDNALKAWETAEELLGDSKLTGDLAMNYANVEPTGKERNPYKNYKKRRKGFERAIELSSYYEKDAGEIEVERRIAMANLDLTVYRVKRNSIKNGTKVGNKSTLRELDKTIEKYSLRGSTFDADLNALYTRYYQQNDQPEKAIEYGQKAIDLYKSRTDKYFSKYEYFVHIFKGDSHHELSKTRNNPEEKINAALEYQTVMQNLEGALPADHPLIWESFQRWLRDRSDLQEAGLLEKAEAAGLCECWPYENYKDKAVPLERVPPVLPSSARRSGHVYVKFDVDDAGRPENLSVVSSTSPRFEESALSSIKKWKYSTYTPGTDRKNRKDISTKITFRLRDQFGNLIPE